MMNHQNLISISKRTALSAALCLALGTGVAKAAPWSGTFTMYAGGSGGLVGKFKTVTGTEKVDLASTSPFFGFLWTAHDLTIYDQPGTYTVDTIQAGTYTFTVHTGQIAGHVLFDWSTTKNIDVINMWNIKKQSNGSTTYDSIDFDCGSGADGYRGCGMIDGPFIGFHANFDMTAFTPYPVNISGSQGGNPLVIVTTAGGNVTLRTNQTVAGGYTFSWAGSDASVVAAAVGGDTNETFVFDPSGLTKGTAYTINVSVTNNASKIVASTSSITIEPATALTNADTDGDGLADNSASEGYADDDGDGIPNYLDPTNNSAALVAINTTDTNLGSMSASTGTVSLGSLALSNSITNMLAGTPASGLAVTTSEIGTSDSAVSASCLGGCFDFKVTGLPEGGSTKVVIPLSAPLGDFPVYRKFSGGKWTGFVIDDNNNISSASALSTAPITCPAAGSSAYSKVGLTPGDYCIQLTMQDGGPNDSGMVDGIITDPSGVALSKEKIMEANVPSGCSMSTVPVEPTQRADWWLIAGFFLVLGGLRSMRRKSHAA